MWRRTPLPLEVVGGMAAGVLAQQVQPLRLPAWTRPTGWAVVCAGLGLVTAAVRERGPGAVDEPTTLAVHGLHARSRNPMYLGVVTAHLGLAGATRNAWLLATCPVSATLLHLTVLREERWLRERFGDAYDIYAAGVPRYW